ncbi:hypothetical protein [Serratia sp. NFX21]|uniref:hypothetical protein n=1 Tax=Serratia sp. NFX21 TaxID=3402279 RepID=UPI003AF3BC47
MGGLVDGNTALDMDNGSYLSIKDKDERIVFDAPIEYWDNIQNGNVKNVIYQADLVVKNTAQTGPASKSIVLNINYC